MSSLSLVKKLAKVMQSVKYIQKRGRNAHFGYTYATEADVAEKVREVLADQNVIMLPSVVGRTFRETTTARGKVEFICTVDMEFTFHDGDSGETLMIKMSGDGQDGGDKAIFKAITGCIKYAQMKAFMIPTGDDPEDDDGERPEQPPTRTAQDKTKGKPQGKSPSDRLITEPQIKRMFAIAGKGRQQLVRQVLDEHGYEGTADVKAADYEEMCAKIEILAEEADEAMGNPATLGIDPADLRDGDPE